MYLSRIALDADRSETMRLMASPHLLHGGVECCFGGERRRNLWRIDFLDGLPYLMILSEVPPDLEALAKKYGRSDLTPPWEVKSYDTLLDRLAEGQQWQFRLRANPVRSIQERGEERGRGRLYNHVTREQQKNWLSARAVKSGFAVEDDAFDVVYSQWLKFRKGASGTGEVTILAVTFEGRLTVTNPALFKSALMHGIGRGKAYGCSLMTIARIGGR